MTGKKRKTARPGYYPCGKKRPVEVGATPELLARKREATGSERLEITPLGILAGRELVTPEQCDAARRFRICHDAVWAELGGPRTSSGTLSWVVSEASNDDAEVAAQRLARGSRADMLDRAFDTYNAYKEGLSALHWELLHWICCYGESSGWHSYGWLEHQIRQQDLHWETDRIVARRDGAILPITRDVLMSVRAALQHIADWTLNHKLPRRHEGESYANFNAEDIVRTNS